MLTCRVSTSGRRARDLRPRDLAFELQFAVDELLVWLAETDEKEAA